MSNFIISPYIFGVGYSAHAVRFDGTNDYLNRGADLTGNAATKEGTFSCWLNFKGGDGVQQGIMANTPENFQIAKLADNTVRANGSNSGAKLNIISTSTFTAAGGWMHLLASWNLATPEAYLYIDDADDEAGGSTEVDSTILYTGTDYHIGSRPAAANKLNADMADLWWDNSFLDITVEANRRKFIDASGKPVDLLSDGSGPTGGSPLICLNDSVTAGWEGNNGTGGGFTENGALADGADSPSD